MSSVASGLPLTTEQQAVAIQTIWAARLVVLLPMISVGIWLVYIPWRVASLNLTPLDFSKLLLCFAISSIHYSITYTMALLATI